MKIIVAYLPEEEREADLICRFVHRLCPGKVRKSDRHPPFKHIYLTTKKAETLAIQGKRLDQPPVLW